MDPSKHCQSCGRPFGKEAHITSNNVKYCSNKCRSERLNVKDTQLELSIIKELTRLAQTNICPSQISRQFFKEFWRENHQRTVKACRRLFLLDKIKITQKKKPITSLNFKGPFRISIN